MSKDKSTETDKDLSTKDQDMDISESATEVNQIQPIIGDHLKQLRESKNISLKMISQHTRISVSMLESLEENEFDKLPNKTYVKGYVKSYAKTLGADQSECLDILEKTYLQVSPQISTQPIIETTTEIHEDNSISLKIGIIVVVFSIISFFAAKKVLNYDDDVENEVVKPQTLTATTPLKKSSTQVTSDEAPPFIKVDESLEEPAKVLSTPISNSSQSTVSFKEEIKVPEEEAKKVAAIVKPIEKKPEPLKTPEPKVKKEKEKSKHNFQPMTVPLYSISATTNQEARKHLPDHIRQAVVTGYQNVFISAVKGESWITYKSDDDPIKKFVLKKERTLLIRGKEIRIFLGNVHATKIFLNNKALKITTKSGVKSLVFPQENRSKFYLPLFIYPGNGRVETSETYLNKNPSEMP